MHNGEASYPLDTLLLSRIQFAANINFHILFPAITIALAWFLVVFKIQHDRGAGPHWMEAYRFWVRIFALCFALGVVSGVTMSFQFGTNWPGFMNTVGNIAGPLLAYEVLTAFFLEATFLGIMLFGVNRVSNRVHTIATLLVAAGTTMSAFWILALNSWMHTPAGYMMIDGKAHAVSWLQVIFNPSMPYRTVHMLLASGLTAAFLIAGVSAYRTLKGERGGSAVLTLKAGVYAAAVIIPFQMVAGDQHGLNTLEHQPAKIAAMEGLWETRRGAPALLFAIPDEATRTNRLEIGLPKVASLLLTHDPDGEVKGLNDFQGASPPVPAVFFGFRAMVGMGIIMLLTSWSAAWQLWRRGAVSKGVARVLTALTFSGWIATTAGWYTTEIGRQPWLVTGLLKTADAVSPLPSAAVGTTLALYLTLYAVLIAAFVSVVFYLARHAGEASRPITPVPGTAASGAKER